LEKYSITFVGNLFQRFVVIFTKEYLPTSVLFFLLTSVLRKAVSN
jgi:hypothetical protein